MSISMLTDEPTTREEPKQQMNCHDCKKFQTDVAKSLELMANRMDQMQQQLDELRKNRKSSPATSSAASSGKASPSPLCVSPKQIQQEQQPIIEQQKPAIIQQQTPNGIHLNGGAQNGSGARKRKPKERTPPTAASPLPDFSNFVNGFMFDPITMAANPNGMMQLLSLVQQQTGQEGTQQQQTSQNQSAQQTPRSMTPPESKPVKMETVTEENIDVTDDVKLENEESMASHTQHLLDALTAQFSSNTGNGAAMNHRVKSESPIATSSASSAGSSAVQQVIEAVATPSRSQDSSMMMDESIGASDPNTARCSNCRTDKTTAWRRDSEGKLVCNPCGLYYRLHKVRRPIEMRKNHIQQRYRRKNKEKDVAASLSDPALFNQLLTQMPSMATGGGPSSGGAATALSFLEQITQFTQAHELMNSSAAGF